MCEVCTEFERQIRDLETEIDTLIDRRDKETRAGVGRASLTDRLDSAVRALKDARALYDHHRVRKHA